MQLIISEKPKAARKIAEALGRVRAQKGGQSYYYEVDDGSIVVAPAVGHVFGLVPKQKSWGYPVFETEWRPKSEQKGFEYVKSYIANLKKLGKQASEIIIATDYDIEGAVIGHNIVEMATGKKPLKRMKFSTLTAQELGRAYDNAHPLNDFEQGMVWAGLTRHYMDWYWGINVSRALSRAISKGGQFRVMSTGRVQGPTLKLLADREKEIKAFSSNFFFQLQLRIGELIAKGDRLDELEKGLRLFDQAERPAIVSSIDKNRFDVSPPPPFNLTDLQSEASKVFKYTPKRTQKIAQTLYEGGFISYPRTSSQKIPKDINTDKILSALARRYPVAKQLIGKKLVQGTKTDPAHPAIYPTGELPPELEPEEQKLYDLIARRFMASFGETAVRESVKAIIELNKVEFVLEGRKTIVPGWFIIYKYAKLEEKELPKMEQGKEIKVDSIELVRDQTRPPKRYTEAGLLKTMEKMNIGTKATRANIIQTLFDRKYIQNKSIEVTPLGQGVIDTLENTAANILSVDMTRDFEQKMEDVQEGRRSMDEVLEEAKQTLLAVLEEFKKKESSVTQTLSQSTSPIIGKCPECGDDVMSLVSMRDKRYAKCKKCGKSWGLPQRGKLTITKEKCKKCTLNLIHIDRGSTKFKLCIEHGFD